MFSTLAAKGAFASLSFVCFLGTAAAQVAPAESPAPPEAPPETQVVPEPLPAPAPVVVAPPVIPQPQPRQEADPPREPRREWGVGSAAGVGFSGVITGTGLGTMKSGVGFAFLLPTLEVRIFNERGHSLDISLPVLNMVVVSALARVFVFSADGYYNFNLGSGQTRFLIGPGLGFATAVVSSDVRIYGLRIPAEIGVEFLSRRRGFGFQIMGRPFMELDFVSGASSVWGGFGGGVMFNLGITFYKTT